MITGREKQMLFTAKPAWLSAPAVVEPQKQQVGCDRLFAWR